MKAVSRMAFIAALVCAAPAFAQARYFSAAEDLPLAPGLAEAGSGFWFHDPNGRILGVTASGPVEAEAVRGFYLETLPALGWALSPGAGAEDQFVFLRGRERLALTIEAIDGGTQLEVRLFVQPGPALRD